MARIEMQFSDGRAAVVVDDIGRYFTQRGQVRPSELRVNDVIAGRGRLVAVRVLAENGAAMTPLLCRHYLGRHGRAWYDNGWHFCPADAMRDEPCEWRVFTEELEVPGPRGEYCAIDDHPDYAALLKAATGRACFRCDDHEHGFTEDMVAPIPLCPRCKATLAEERGAALARALVVIAGGHYL